MTNEQFEKWERLVHHVIHTRFAWAFSRKKFEGYVRRSARLMDYDDLFSEGCIGLSEAFDSYQEEKGATFKTWAYEHIRTRVLKFVSANTTPIKTPRNSSTNPENARLARASNRCSLFSEMSPDGKMSKSVDSSLSVHSGHEQVIDDSDYVERKIGKIKAFLSNKEYKMILDRASGMTYSAIGKKYRISHEHARATITRIMLRCSSMFGDEDD